MKKARLLMAIGTAMVLVGLGVCFVGAPYLVRFPQNVDQTSHYTGTITSFTNPSTFATLAKPVQVPLTVTREVKVVSSTHSDVVIDETIHLSFAGTTRTELYRYVMNRTSMQLLTSAGSYAFANPTSLIQAKGDYRVNLPMGFNSSSIYLAFAPQADVAVPLKATGPSHYDAQAGVTVTTFATSLNAPVAPYYLSYLKAQGLPMSLSASAVVALLQSHNVNFTQALTDLRPHLSAAESATVDAVLAKPVPVDYSYFYQGDTSAQSQTGAIVDSQSSSEGVAATLDLSGDAALLPILAQYSSIPSVHTLLSALGAEASAPPQPVLQMTYAQTPASVHAAGTFAKSQASKMNLLQWQFPLALGVLGALLVVAGLVWRPRHPAAGAGPTLPQPEPATTEGVLL